MQNHFKHPLARTATTAKLRGRDGMEQDCLIIVTTLELEPKAKNFSAKNVQRLQDAARDYLAATDGLASYAIVNRPKDWR